MQTGPKSPTPHDTHTHTEPASILNIVKC